MPGVKRQTKPRKGEKWHGTVSGYQTHKCSCEECKGAWNKYQKRLRRKRYSKAECLVRSCKRKAWLSAGNGLCHVHHQAKIELRAKRAREKRKRASRKKTRASQA
jgi:hypothetical protein